MSALISFGIKLTFSGTISLPISGIVSNVVIDWGDGITDTTSSIYPSHTYNSAGSYTININSGNFTALDNNNNPNPSLYISSLTSFSYYKQINELTSFRNAFDKFYTIFSLYFAPDITNNVTDINLLFFNDTIFYEEIYFKYKYNF